MDLGYPILFLVVCQNSIKLMGKANQHSIDENSMPASRIHSFAEKDFENLFRNHFKALCGYCAVKFGFDIDLSKDMVHAAFVKLWETRDVDFSDVAAKGYLQRIVVNNCLDHLRHEKIKAGYEAFVKKFSSDVVHEDSFDIAQLQKDIEKSIAALPEQMRNVFILSRYSGLKYKQIAKHLGISVKTVETQMVRALYRLRQQLPGLPALIALFFSAEL